MEIVNKKKDKLFRDRGDLTSSTYRPWQRQPRLTQNIPAGSKVGPSPSVLVNPVAKSTLTGNGTNLQYANRNRSNSTKYRTFGRTNNINTHLSNGDNYNNKRPNQGIQYKYTPRNKSIHNMGSTKELHHEHIQVPPVALQAPNNLTLGINSGSPVPVSDLPSSPIALPIHTQTLGQSGDNLETMNSGSVEVNITPPSSRLAFYKNLNDIRKEFNLPPTPIPKPVTIKSPRSIKKFLADIRKDLNLGSNTTMDTSNGMVLSPLRSLESTRCIADLTVHEDTLDVQNSEHLITTREDTVIIVDNTHKGARAVVPFLGAVQQSPSDLIQLGEIHTKAKPITMFFPIQSARKRKNLGEGNGGALNPKKERKNSPH